jgi:hypothetical protein
VPDAAGLMNRRKIGHDGASVSTVSSQGMRGELQMDGSSVSVRPCQFAPLSDDLRRVWYRYNGIAECTS